MKIEIITGAADGPVAEFFSSSNTPETDANEAWPASNLKLGDSSVVPADFARKLERERNDAREHLREIKEYGTEEINAAIDLRQRLAAALVERDAARELAQQMSESNQVLMADVRFYRNAWEQLKDSAK